MGNEQQRGTSHHFLPEHPGAKGATGQLWTRNGRMPASKQLPTVPSITSKPNWQLTRDASMDILERKTTKLSYKPSKVPDGPITSRSVMKKYPVQETNYNEKPKPIYQTPRMPTDKDVSRVSEATTISFRFSTSFVQISVAYQLLCSFCEGPCIGDYLRCRVCVKAFHCQCLYERGYLPNQSFSLPRMSKQDWTCPECVRRRTAFSPRLVHRDV